MKTQWCTWIVSEPNSDYYSTWIKAEIGSKGECNTEAHYRRSIGQPAEVLPWIPGAHKALVPARDARVECLNLVDREGE